MISKLLTFLPWVVDLSLPRQVASDLGPKKTHPKNPGPPWGAIELHLRTELRRSPLGLAGRKAPRRSGLFANLPGPLSDILRHVPGHMPHAAQWPRCGLVKRNPLVLLTWSIDLLAVFAQKEHPSQ